MAGIGMFRYNNLLTRIVTSAVVAGMFCSLTGCEQAKKTRQDIDNTVAEAQHELETSHRVGRTLVYDPLTVTDKVWNGGSATRMQRGMPLPPRYEIMRGVTLVSADPMSLSDIASAISAQTGIPIRLSSLSIPSKAGNSLSDLKNSGSTGAASSPGGGGSSALTAAPMPISYEGPLSGLLDRLSAYFGVSWRYDGSTISVTRYETRIFSIEALPGTQQVNEGMQDDVTSSSGSSASSTGTTATSSSTQNTLTQNSKTTMDFKYWDELTQVLNSIVGGQGSVVVSPSIGTVTITTTPDLMTSVSDYLAKENKRMSRQIAINVQIYNVNLGHSEDFSVAFTGFLKNLSKFSGMDYTTAAVPSITNTNITSASLGSLSVAILNGPNDPTAHAGDVFKALSTVGDTTNVAQFPMTTLNNRPVSRRVGTDTTYVASIVQNTTTSTSSQTTYTPTTGTVHDGFSLQLTPRLLDDGRIILQYSLSLIGLESLQQTSFGGLTLDLPVTDNRIFVQQSMLRSGQTLMIGGVDQRKLAQNKQGVGSPDNFLFGGGTSSNDTHFMMFMAITPQVMDLNDEEHP